MDIKTFEKLFKLKNELDLHKSTIEKLKALQEQASLLRRQLAADDENIYCMDDRPWRPRRVTPLQYIQLVANSENKAEFKLNEYEWNAIVYTAIKLEEYRVNEIIKEVEAI